jgi:hypothetical protein
MGEEDAAELRDMLFKDNTKFNNEYLKLRQMNMGGLSRHKSVSTSIGGPLKTANSIGLNRKSI